MAMYRNVTPLLMPSFADRDEALAAARFPAGRFPPSHKPPAATG
jgi:hypothetical protein